MGFTGSTCACAAILIGVRVSLGWNNLDGSAGKLSSWMVWFNEDMTRCPAAINVCANHPSSAWQNRLQDTEESCTVRHHIIKDAHLALQDAHFALELLDFATSGNLGSWSWESGRHKIHCRSDDHQLGHLGGPTYSGTYLLKVSVQAIWSLWL